MNKAKHKDSISTARAFHGVFNSEGEVKIPKKLARSRFTTRYYEQFLN